MKNLKFTLKAWPVVTIVTIGLCFLTQQVAKLIGIDLPDQKNVELVRNMILAMFDSKNAFLGGIFLLSQVLILLPVAEEFIFRYLAVLLPWRIADRKFSSFVSKAVLAVLSTLSAVLFSAAHYISQPFDAAFLALFFFGLAQIYIYLKTKNIWFPILNHALFNLTNLVLALSLPTAS